MNCKSQEEKDVMVRVIRKLRTEKRTQQTEDLLTESREENVNVQAVSAKGPQYWRKNKWGAQSGKEKTGDSGDRGNVSIASRKDILKGIAQN